MKSTEIMTWELDGDTWHGQATLPDGTLLESEIEKLMTGWSAIFYVDGVEVSRVGHLEDAHKAKIWSEALAVQSK